MKRAAAIVVFALSAAGCIGQTDAPDKTEGPTSQPVTLQSEGGDLQLTKLTGDTLAGVHLQAGLQPQFESIALAEKSATSVVRLGDKTFEWKMDQANGIFVLDGHDATISAEEKDALTKLLHAVEGVYVKDPKVGPTSPIPFHAALLLGQIKWLADERVGAKVARFDRMIPTAEELAKVNAPSFDASKTARPPSAEAPKEVGYYYGQEAAWNWCTAPAGYWQYAYITPDLIGWTGRWAVVNGAGGYYDSWGGWEPNKNWTQWGNWTCQGQCGVGCQDWWHSGRFTDCFEHDVCTDWGPDWGCDLDKAWAAAAFSSSYTGICR